MPTTDHENYRQRLHRARKGGGIPFCGPEFSSDYVNFNPDQTLGTGAQLLAVINEKLDLADPFKDLRNAAEMLHERIADQGMMGLLKKRYQVSEVTQHMVDIMKFPWDAIYTTNYDNAIGIAARRANRTCEGLNNTDDPLGAPDCYAGCPPAWVC
jgi:hypothetical protein